MRRRLRGPHRGDPGHRGSRAGGGGGHRPGGAGAGDRRHRCAGLREHAGADRRRRPGRRARHHAAPSAHRPLPHGPRGRGARAAGEAARAHARRRAAPGRCARTHPGRRPQGGDLLPEPLQPRQPAAARDARLRRAGRGARRLGIGGVDPQRRVLPGQALARHLGGLGRRAADQPGDSHPRSGAVAAGRGGADRRARRDPQVRGRHRGRGHRRSAAPPPRRHHHLLLRHPHRAAAPPGGDRAGLRERLRHPARRHRRRAHHPLGRRAGGNPRRTLGDLRRTLLLGRLPRAADPRLPRADRGSGAVLDRPGRGDGVAGDPQGGLSAERGGGGRPGRGSRS